MSRKRKYSILPLLIVVTIVSVLVLLFSKQQQSKKLPVLGEPGHTTGSFVLTNQNGQPFNSAALNGKIHVVEFFFTTCKGICPRMNKNMQKVYQQFLGNNAVRFVSFTVDPAHDTAPVLKQYADLLKADIKQWIFLTGNKDSLYKIAREQYLLSAADTAIAEAAEEFIHTQYFALVDQQNRIRGFYDGTNEKEMIKLVADIQSLL